MDNQYSRGDLRLKKQTPAIIRFLSVLLIISVISAVAGCSNTGDTEKKKSKKKTTYDTSTFEGASEMVKNAVEDIYGAEESDEAKRAYLNFDTHSDWQQSINGKYFSLTEDEVSSYFRDLDADTNMSGVGRTFIFENRNVEISVFEATGNTLSSYQDIFEDFKDNGEDTFEIDKKHVIEFFEDDDDGETIMRGISIDENIVITVKCRHDPDPDEYIKTEEVLLERLEKAYNDPDNNIYQDESAKSAIDERKEFLDDYVEYNEKYQDLMEAIGFEDVSTLVDKYEKGASDRKQEAKKKKDERQKQREEMQTIDYDAAMIEDDVYTPLTEDQFVIIMELTNYTVEKTDIPDNAESCLCVKQRSMSSVSNSYNDVEVTYTLYKDEKDAIDAFYENYIDYSVQKEFDGFDELYIQKDGSKYIIEIPDFDRNGAVDWYSYKSSIRAGNMVIDINYSCSVEDKELEYVDGLMSVFDQHMKASTSSERDVQDCNNLLSDGFVNVMTELQYSVTYGDDAVLATWSFEDYGSLMYTLKCCESVEAAREYFNQEYGYCQNQGYDITPYVFDAGKDTMFYADSPNYYCSQQYVIRKGTVVVVASVSYKDDTGKQHDYYKALLENPLIKLGYLEADEDYDPEITPPPSAPATPTTPTNPITPTAPKPSDETNPGTSDAKPEFIKTLEKEGYRISVEDAHDYMPAGYVASTKDSYGNSYEYACYSLDTEFDAINLYSDIYLDFEEDLDPDQPGFGIENMNHKQYSNMFKAWVLSSYTSWNQDWYYYVVCKGNTVIEAIAHVSTTTSETTAYAVLQDVLERTGYWVAE